VTSSTFVLKCGIHGGSTIGKFDKPIVGDGSTKSMLGGGIFKTQKNIGIRMLHAEGLVIK